MADLITLLANLALALTFIAGLIFGIVQVRTAARDRKERLTLETLRNFQTREFAELIHYFNSHDLPATTEGLQALRPEEQIMLIQFGQEMETVGFLVAEKFIDIDLVEKILGVLVTNTWEKYEPLFIDGRQNQPDPFLGEYFQWLAERIDERMKEKPRIPFHTGKQEKTHR
jgi:hypothetical protein